MEYELAHSLDGESYSCVSLSHADGSVSFIPMDEANSDYQQYLIDTDGGLPDQNINLDS